MPAPLRGAALAAHITAQSEAATVALASGRHADGNEIIIDDEDEELRLT